MATNSYNNKNAVEDESHDLMHCCICMEEYDCGVHKPKFISCHHTFCLQCLKKMIADLDIASRDTSTSVACPVCKTVCPLVGQAEQLPTNTYALNIVQLFKATTTSKIKSWCLVCHGAPTKHCHGHHLVIDLSKDTEQLESLLVMKSTEISKCLKEAIAMREKIEEYLQLHLKAIKTLMAQNSDRLQVLQVKVAREARMNRLEPTQQVSSFSSIIKDLERASQEAKNEAKAAEKMFNQVSVMKLPKSEAELTIELGKIGVPVAQVREAEADEKINFFSSTRSEFSIGRLQSTQSIHCRDLINHGSIIRALEFSDDGSLLVSGGAGDLVHLWNVDQVLNNRSGKSIPTSVLKVTSEFIGVPPFSMAISPDNNRILIAGSYPYIFSYDAHTAMQVNAVPHHSNTAFSISLQPGRNDHVFAAACDSNLRILDTRSSSHDRSVIDMARSWNAVILWSVMFSPIDSNQVAVSSSQDGAMLYDIRSPNSFLYRFPNPTAGTKSVRFNGKGTRLLCSTMGKSLALYDVPPFTNREEDCVYFTTPGYEIKRDLVIKSPCCFAGTNDELVVGASDDKNIYVWSSHDQPFRVLRGHNDTINSVRYNVRKGILASCGIEGIVKLWSN